MKTILLIAAILLIASGVQAQQAKFFTSVPDLPLMAGLEEQVDQTLVFDKAGGRIIELYAILDAVKPDQVSAYYESALPAFGWSKVAPMAYERDSERLSLLFEKETGPDVLHIMITPQ